MIDVFRESKVLTSHTHFLSLLSALCVSQCLAHVEAFIDFSEDELIEDGVLDQGMCTLCPSLDWRNMTEQSSLGLSEELCFSLKREGSGWLSCLDLQLAISCVCCTVGRSHRHHTA